MIYATMHGRRVPALGFGTWQLNGEQCVRGVRTALDAGYRHIDTAQAYENEAEIGRAIAERRDLRFRAGRAGLEGDRAADRKRPADQPVLGPGMGRRLTRSGPAVDRRAERAPIGRLADEIRAFLSRNSRRCGRANDRPVPMRSNQTRMRKRRSHHAQPADHRRPDSRRSRTAIPRRHAAQPASGSFPAIADTSCLRFSPTP